MIHCRQISILSLAGPILLAPMITFAQSEKGQNWWDTPTASIISSPTESTKEFTGPFIIGHPAFQDEGRGLFLRRIGFSQSQQAISKTRALRSPILAYMDGQGDSREILLGLSKKEKDSKIERASGSGTARVFATIWSWDEKGPSKNPLVNTVVWGGLHEMINNTDGWLGPYDSDFVSTGIPKPTYPSGESAVGYFSLPQIQFSKFYDALGGKDIFGRPAIQVLPHQGEKEGLPQFDINNTKISSGHVRFAKDITSSWWHAYNTAVVKQYLSRGVDGFWLDNNSGRSFIGVEPIRTAFGSWSLSGFPKFLAAHGRKAPSKGNIKEYILQVAAQLDPSFKPEAFDLTSEAFKDPRWTADPMWLAYLSYKSIISAQRAKDFYSMVKEEAQTQGRDPKKILVGASDHSVFPFANTAGVEADQIHTRYSPLMSPELGKIGRGLPTKGSNGPFYALTSAYTKSTWSHIWLSLPSEMGISSEMRRNLAPMLAAEAMANNAILAGDDTSELFALTEQEGARLAKVFAKVGPAFQGRDRLARVAILYSPNTLYSTLTPGGFRGADATQLPKNENEPSVLHHGLAVQGWAELIESLNIPYRIIPDFRLSEKALTGIQVLIIPHVTSFEREWIAKALKPFLSKMKVILMTGSQFGERQTVANLFAPQKNLLAELKANETAERFIFLEGNPGAEYHLALMKEQRERILAVRKIVVPHFETLRKNIPMDILQIQSPRLAQTTRTVTHTRRGEHEYFFDIYNVSASEKTFEAIPNEGGKATIDPPMPSDKISLRWFDEQRNSFVNLAYTKGEGGKLQIQIPAFKYYGSIHLVGIE